MRNIQLRHTNSISIQPCWSCKDPGMQKGQAFHVEDCTVRQISFTKWYQMAMKEWERAGWTHLHANSWKI